MYAFFIKNSKVVILIYDFTFFVQSRKKIFSLKILDQILKFSLGANFLFSQKKSKNIHKNMD